MHDLACNDSEIPAEVAKLCMFLAAAAVWGASLLKGRRGVGTQSKLTWACTHKLMTAK